MDKHESISVLKIAIVFFLTLLMSASVVFAEGENDALKMDLRPSGSEASILLKAVNVDGEPYFFLPSGVKEENTENTPGEGISYQTMQSANIASLHFFSSDAEKGIEYVHTSKDNKAPGEVYMFDENFKQIYHGKVDALKGRGNTTWDFTDKKSYQIKLDKKADLLDPGKGSQKAKKWILLANPFDPTLIRNYMIYNFGKELGIDCCTEGRPVDLYYDGEYRGSYYLCEKAEVGDGRVEINDLDKAVEKANPDVDLDELEEVKANNSKGREVKYEGGMNDPEDISGGYLLELDSVYYDTEKSWFKYDGLAYAVVKSPEYNSGNMIEYISSLFTDMYYYVVKARRDNKDGEELSKYIDMDSFAKYFLVNEWFANNDVWTSSTFIYKPEGEDLLYAGPVWDCDSSLRIGEKVRDYNKWYAAGDEQPLGNQLFGLPSFRRKLQEVYKNEMRPIIYDTLLGTESGNYLKPYKAMKEELASSAAMNYMIWDIDDCLGSYHPEATLEENYETDLEWMKNRAVWFDKRIMSNEFVQSSSDVYRIYGSTRYETSLKAADAFKAELGIDKFDSVILACGTNYADALAGSYLSCVRNAPILLVDDNNDHIKAVKDYVQKNLAKGGTVYLLGGSAVVPDKAVAGLDGFTLNRLSGATRYETNIEILKEAVKYAGDADEYMICSGTGFADSLSASATCRPIILVKDSIQDDQKEYLASLKGKKFYIIGGTGAVNSGIEAEIREIGETIRISGKTRYETSTNVAKEFFNKPGSAVLAYGENFPDGLCGGSLAYSMKGPLILATNTKTVASEEYAKANSIKMGVILGGPKLISDANGRKFFGLSGGAAILAK